MAILPSDVPTRLVTATMYFVNEDSVDPDTKPEYTVVTGSVVFTASPKTIRMISKPAILVPLTFEGVFDSEGQLIPKDGTGVGMELIVTNSPLLNPTDWTWTCTFNLKVAGTQNTVNIDSFSFQLPAGTLPLDLVSLMPVSASPGVLTIRGPKGDPGDTVAEARLAALETAKVTIDNTVGRRAFAWDAANSRQQMIYGDTGFRSITSLANGFVSGAITLRIKGGWAQMIFDDCRFSFTGTQHDIFLAGTSGITSVVPLTGLGQGVLESTSDGGCRITAFSSGRVAIYGTSSNGFFTGSVMWATDRPWPTSLPGTPIGTIPT